MFPLYARHFKLGADREHKFDLPIKGVGLARYIVIDGKVLMSIMVYPKAVEVVVVVARLRWKSSWYRELDSS